MLHELTSNSPAYLSWLAFLAVVGLAALVTQRELRKTLAFVAVALLLTGMASFRLPGRGGTDAFFNDQGQKFFPKFEDPLTATALEVVGYNPQTASAIAFKVMRKDGRWVIPSHSDYPADAKDRLVKTASGVIDLTKDTIRSDRPEDHKIFGVLDPKDIKATTIEGLGKRVTLYNKTGEVLADFIIGKEVPGHPQQRYVRVPGKNRTYGVNVNVDLSTRFPDWIETNLLKLQAAQARELIFDNHKVDPEQGTYLQGDRLTLSRKDASSPWTMKGLEPDLEVNADRVSTLVSSLADLKIVGVRPKPPGLTSELKASSGGQGISLDAGAIDSLERKGFYLTRDGKLVSNQGDVYVATEEGVIYTLRFGEVTFAQGEALSAGTGESANPTPEETKKGEGATESRYLFVTATFDPDLIPQPGTSPPEKLPEDVFARDPKDPQRVAAEKAETERADQERAAYEAKLDQGKKVAEQLNDRFAAWYYVVPGDAARKVLLSRADLTQKIGQKPATPPRSNPGPGLGIPGFPGGLPPGLSLPAGHP